MLGMRPPQAPPALLPLNGRAAARWTVGVFALAWLAGNTLAQESGAPKVTPAPIVVTNAAQVMSTEADAIRKTRHLARLRGVLIYQPTSDASWLSLQDESGAVQVSVTNRVGMPEIGTTIEVEGELLVGTFHPQVGQARVQRVGQAILPEPKPDRPDALGTARNHGQFIQIEGSVIDMVREDDRPTLLVSSRGITYNVYVGEVSESLPWEWMERRVELRGVLLNYADNAGKPSIFRLLTASNSWVRLLEAPGTNRFERPLVTARQLSEASLTNDERLLVRGTVIHAPGASWVVLRDETGPMVVDFINPIPANTSPRRRSGGCRRWSCSRAIGLRRWARWF